MPTPAPPRTIRLPPELESFADQRLARLTENARDAGVAFHDDAGVAERLRQVVVASDFAYECLLRVPEWLGAEFLTRFSDPRHAAARRDDVDLGACDETTQMLRLRRFRRLESLRLVWRDITGQDSVAETLAGATELAEVCLEAALAAAERTLVARHGEPQNAAGARQRLVVLGFGKLGGGELNFSSDIDLIMAFPEAGQSAGERPLDNEIWFARQVQLITKLLAAVSADGFAFRVDLRLRPFGTVGRPVLSFAAMEQYYQREGRDWERYAWIKARPVAGDFTAGKQLIELLRPFVWRRYLDYTAFAGLREMKALIDAEVARKDLAEHIKLGPGGIREIEFIVQLAQLIRGGRERSLRERGLLPALAAVERIGAIRQQSARRLREAYEFLRKVENRLQMVDDQQTHELPADPILRLRLAATLGFSNWDEFCAELGTQRAAVAEEFAAVMPKQAAGTTVANEWSALWRRAVDLELDSADLVAAGFDAAEALLDALHGLVRSAAVRGLSARSRARLDRLLPQLLAAAQAAPSPVQCARRLIGLVQAVARRSSYLALLDEQPLAFKRVVDVAARSAFLTERLTEHPMLLDELLDARLMEEWPERASIAAELARRLSSLENADDETELEVLAEEKHSVGFRLGLARLEDRLPAPAVAQRLAELAEVILAETLALAERDAIRQFGRPQGHLGNGSGLALVGYGSLGGAEIGFTSDLDLVFLYDGALGQVPTDGARTLEGARYYARISQRVVHLLTTLNRAGRLYEVDVRLRPDGAKGLLVMPIEAFADYQRERAWTWEHQALVRARCIAGDRGLAERFAQIRQEILGRPREPSALAVEVAKMRARWRAELDRSHAAQLDLKQGRGALVDIEFMLQWLLLTHAQRAPELTRATHSADLIAALAKAGILTAQQAENLLEAHAILLGAALDCALDARPRLQPLSTALEQATAMVIATAAELRFDLGMAAS